MPTTINGNWSVRVLSKQFGALPQRFVITGATSGNGTYGEDQFSPVSVTGLSWQVQCQHSETYEPPFVWGNNNQRKTATRIENGFYVFEIESEDSVDTTWNDLILQFMQPAPVVPPPPPPVVPPPVIPPTPPPPPVPPIPGPPPYVPPSGPPNLGFGRVYTKFPVGDKYAETDRETRSIWSNGSGSLVTFHTGSGTFHSGSYKLAIHHLQWDDCCSAVQFDVAYGHSGGSGSQDFSSNDNLTPTRAVYGQYRNLCLDPPQRKFKIGSRELDSIYVITVKPDRMGERLDAGHLELNLAHLSGSQFESSRPRNAHTGSNITLLGNGQVLRLIDDSGLDFSNLGDVAMSGSYSNLVERSRIVTSAGEVHYLVSGSLEAGVFNPTNPTVYGLLYPRSGVFILDGQKLDGQAGFLTVSGSDIFGDNPRKLFVSISGSGNLTDSSGDLLGFKARKVVERMTEFYWIRVKNQEYNFTNNPTYATGSEGEIIGDFYGNPQTYFTSVGLYNDNHELLAIGKMSRAIHKNYSTEALLQMKLEIE